VTLDRQQPSLKQSLLDWQQKTPGWQAETPTLITVLGGDQLLGVRLQQPKSAQERFFFSVQWTREGLRDFQFPVVLWVTEAVAQGLAQQAPDFWSWRGGVFEFVQPMAWQQSDPSRGSEQRQPESAETDEPLADPADLERQIVALETEDPDSPLLASLYQSLGITYYQRLKRGLAANRPQEEARAIHAFQSAMARQEPLADQAPLALSLSYLALLYKAQGRYSEAEPLFQRALSISEQQLGNDHPDVATCLDNLANLYSDQGHYSEAEPLFQRALSIGEQQLGNDHPDVATCLNNLAELYRAQGRYSEAEPLFQRALSIGEQQLGNDHPDVATRLNNLAELYRAQGRYSEAEPLYQRALSIGEQQLGNDHPDVATWLNNLANLYSDQGRYSEAEPLYQQAIQIDRQVLGEDHPSFAIHLANLAGLYTEQGRYAEAEKLYLQAYQIDVNRLGAEHPSTQNAYNGLVNLVRQAVEAGQTAALSNDPLVQDLIRQATNPPP